MEFEGYAQHGVRTDNDVLILGWWNQIGVFAGFDLRKSQSVQTPTFLSVSEETLREAYIYGLSFYYADQRKMVFAFRPEFLMEYAQLARLLHDFGRSRDATALLRRVFLEQNDGKVEDQFFGNGQRHVVARLSEARSYHDFRRRVLTSYNNRCALCGCRLGPIKAVHIIPATDQNSTDEKRNGLALCALHQRSFEQGLVTVDDRYCVLVNEAQVDEIKALKLAEGIDRFKRDLLPMILLPPAISDRPHVEYIKTANRVRGWSA